MYTYINNIQIYEYICMNKYIKIIYIRIYMINKNIYLSIYREIYIYTYG